MLSVFEQNRSQDVTHVIVVWNSHMHHILGAIICCSASVGDPQSQQTRAAPNTRGQHTSGRDVTPERLCCFIFLYYTWHFDLWLLCESHCVFVFWSQKESVFEGRVCVCVCLCKCVISHVVKLFSHLSTVRVGILLSVWRLFLHTLTIL